MSKQYNNKVIILISINPEISKQDFESYLPKNIGNIGVRVGKRYPLFNDIIYDRSHS